MILCCVELGWGKGEGGGGRESDGIVRRELTLTAGHLNIHSWSRYCINMTAACGSVSRETLFQKIYRDNV